MTRRLLRIGIPAAVAAAVILAVGLWPVTGPSSGSGGSGRVYALSDIPGLLRNAKVLHLHEWFYIPNPSQGPPGVQRRKIGLDMWLDVENGRWREEFTDLGLTDGSPPTAEQKKIKYRWLQRVSDGEHMLDLWCDTPVFIDDPSVKKTAEFTRLTPFMRELKIRRMYPRLTAFAEVLNNPDTLSRFVRIGQEDLDGVTFDIWESEQEYSRVDRATGTAVYDGLQRGKTRVWLSPATGVVGRIEHWFKGPTTNGVWVDDGGIDEVERDVVPPAGIFDTEVPPEYTLRNTRETAPLASISDNCNILGFGELEIRCHIFFPLNDGTILFGWSSRDLESEESQAALFADLTPGDPLPKLPIEVQAFVPENPDCDLIYTGRHLAWTQKGERFYEWSLFVPDRELTAPRDRCAKFFQFRYVVNSANAVADQQEPLRHPAAGFPFYAVRNPAEFDELVLGAMAELSDSGTAPDHVTYDYVLQLSHQIRASLTEP